MRACALVLVAALGFVVDGKGAKPMTDQERIQGSWQLISGERQGQAFPEETVREVTLTFAGDKLSTRSKNRVTEARFTLHPDTDPTGIDLDMGGAVGLGIYRLVGDDLKIAHGEVGDPRPGGFAVKEGSPLTVLVLKRAGK